MRRLENIITLTRVAVRRRVGESFSPNRFSLTFFFFETQGEVLGMHRSVRRFEIYLKMILRRLRVKMMRLIRMRKTRLTLPQRQQFDFNLCGVVITIETEYTN